MCRHYFTLDNVKYDILVSKFLMNLSKLFRHITLSLLVILLAVFTFLSIQKVYSEETVTSFYHMEDGASLPSVTICIKWFHTSVPNTFEHLDWNWSLSNSGDWNFEVLFSM